MAANWTAFVAGNVLTAAQLNGVVDNFADIAVFNETQANNTDGGTYTSGSYVKRVLNTTIVNNIAGCSIATSVVTLPAGTFYIKGTAPCFGVDNANARLQNTTAATTIRYGQNARSGSGDSTMNSAIVETVVTFTGNTNIELQFRGNTTKANIGLGVPSNFGNDEIYSTLFIARIA